jgi:hypothetical protein
MEIASVIRKMPMIKPIIRKVGNAMKSARAVVEEGAILPAGQGM